ncbi:RNA ligase (ATP) [Methyloversatilis sp.]|uniref:RNA ligase (ATP) n=1 Tax=Methyloversatilis sp. TaxID=2569862 RepID=UPI0035B10EEC
MAEFKCEVVRVKVVPHPNADRLDIAQVGDYQSIIGKGYVKDGDLAVYIPEQAVVPEWLLRELKLWDETKGKGMCAGSLGNRVKAIKLRGVLSQGVIYRANCGDDPNPTVALVSVLRGSEPEIWESCPCEESDDVSEFLGVVKYEPKLPSHMMGKAIGVDLDITHNYDFDNLKKHPRLFDDGEQVVITEKIHGTLLQVAVVPQSKENDKLYKGRVALTSKGLGGRGIILDHNDETNLYAQTVKKHGIADKLIENFSKLADATNSPIIIFGEVFGRTLSGAGVQDLTYTDEELDFRAFDMCYGVRADAKFFDFRTFTTACSVMGLKTVPVLYEGPFSKAVVAEHTDGNTTLSTKKQIREGVVVKSLLSDGKGNRKIAKSVSEAYLLRKDATEFN